MSVPSAPQITVRPLATNGALQFYWAAPVSDGGSAITGYTLSCSGETPQSVDASTYTYIYTGLTNGTTYTFSITAENANGSSPAATFRSVQPGNAPGPVQNLAVSRSAAPAATLTWTAPASDGGATIRGYAIDAVSTDIDDPTIKVDLLDSGATSATITGLTSGSVYSYSVKAVNDAAYSTDANSGLHSMVETSYQYPINGGYNFWGGIACDISGTKLLATTGQPGSLPQPLYRSNDGGATWKEETTSVATYRQWRKCASSADGTKLVAVVGSSGLPYRSTDSGQTWTALSSASPSITHSWTGIVCSSDGSIIMGSASGVAIRYSLDGGSTWGATSAGLLGWSGYCCSANGQMMAACSSTFISVSTDTGANWTQQTAAGSRGWAAIACSSDGSKIVACASDGTIYRTTDTGANWSLIYTLAANPASNVFTAIACSADGTRIYATTRYAIFVSTDSGTTWQRNAVSWSRLTTVVFNHMVCSRDGMTVYATKANGNIWKSDNGGAIWRELSSPRLNQQFMTCMSTNGMIQYFADQTPGIQKIYKTTDKGATWTGITVPGAGLWRGVCCTPDGLKIAATEGGNSGSAGYVWTSTDGGATFTQQLASGARNWRAIACDISGTKLVAAEYTSTGYIYTSSDSGVTWTARTVLSARSWYGVACSADGSKIVACDTVAGQPYISTDSGVSWIPAVTVLSGGGTMNAACTPDFSQVFVSSTSAQKIWRSTDGGLNWTAIYSGRGIRGIAVSSDGTKIIAAGPEDAVGSLLSTNSGASWTTIPATLGKVSFAVGMSADGSVWNVTFNGGGGPIVNRLFG